MIALPVCYLAEPSSEELIERVDSLCLQGAQSLMLLLGEDVDFAQSALEACLQRQKIPVFGGIFPRVIFETDCSAKGAVLVALSEKVEVGVIDHMSTRPVTQTLAECGLSAATRPASVLLWVDAFAPQLEGLVEAVYDRFGAKPSYLGGGAGSISFQPRPCIICNRGVLRDAGLVVALPQRIGVGVDHGWQAVAGPFLVSEAHGNEIRTLDYQPAGQVFRAAVEPLAEGGWEDRAFFEIAKAFPFGVERMDGSLMVRDPIRMVGNRLICVGEVPAQTCAYILRGRPESLIAAATNGSQGAFEDLRGEAAVAALMVGCISRALFLGEGYRAEMDAVRAVIRRRCSAEVHLFGVLSLGEVASASTGGHEFLNKTFALGLIPQSHV